ALTPGQIQNQMRFIFQNNNTTIQLDNFLITDDLNLLPVHLQHFTGQLVGLQPELTWAAVNLTPGTSFAIERSATGQAPFAEIGQLAVPAGASSAFAWTDRQPLPGTNYYRLALRLPGQAPTYSRVVAVAPVAVFAPQLGPNPATDLVTLSTLGDGPGQWQLFDNQGHLLATVPWSATRPVIRWSVEHLRPGLYVWQARNQQGQSSQGRLVKR
ncbi:MAG: T9SS type A sorting domain-containing protein, partial [Bernardetiaceae bacterium]|nr:T9SS type A sorting domain-containing protein [Bernardetiaceae bacterium]